MIHLIGGFAGFAIDSKWRDLSKRLSLLIDSIVKLGRVRNSVYVKEGSRYCTYLGTLGSGWTLGWI